MDNLTRRLKLGGGLLVGLAALSSPAWSADLPVVAPQTPEQVIEDRWAFEFTPYLWMAALGGETTGGDSISMPFDEILSELNIGVMGSFSAERNRFGFYSDLIYLDLSNTESTTANVIGFPISVRAKSKVRGLITTNSVGYQLINTPQNKAVAFGGMRYMWLDAEIDYTVGGIVNGVIDEQGHNFDAVAGLRGHVNLSDRWQVSYYGDVGTGQSELTWQTFAGLGYRFKKFDALIGYRYLDYRFRDNDLVDDLNIHGPMIGTRFRF